jgi:hypothetical protein
MQRLIGLMAALLVVLGLGASVVTAAGYPQPTDRILVATNGATDVASGDDLGALFVLGGDATISGDVKAIVVVDGTVTLSGATAGSLTVIEGSAILGAGSTVRGDVRTLDGTVTQEPGATIQGSVESLDGDLAAVAVLLIPAFILLFFGFGLVAIAAALVVAAFGARQVRGIEELIRREPGQVLVAGIVGMIALPVAAVLMIMTIVGAPLGLAIFFVVLPALAFLAWIVAAIWVGDWIVARLRGATEADRPYLAAVLGVVVLAIAGLVPFVSAIATLFGFGALLLTAWRTFRNEAPPLGDGLATRTAPSAA